MILSGPTFSLLFQLFLLLGLLFLFVGKRLRLASHLEEIVALQRRDGLDEGHVGGGVSQSLLHAALHAAHVAAQQLAEGAEEVARLVVRQAARDAQWRHLRAADAQCDCRRNRRSAGPGCCCCTGCTHGGGLGVRDRHFVGEPRLHLFELRDDVCDLGAALVRVLQTAAQQRAQRRRHAVGHGRHVAGLITRDDLRRLLFAGGAQRVLVEQLACQQRETEHVVEWTDCGCIWLAQLGPCRPRAQSHSKN